MAKLAWKARLKRHPLFDALTKYGAELNECAKKIDEINQTIARIRTAVRDEIRRYLPEHAVKRVSPVWERSIKIGQVGKYGVYWLGDERPTVYYNRMLVNIRSIANGRISYRLFPLAYFLGCVSDFELLALSGSDPYRWFVKRLIRDRSSQAKNFPETKL